MLDSKPRDSHSGNGPHWPTAGNLLIGQDIPSIHPCYCLSCEEDLQPLLLIHRQVRGVLHCHGWAVHKLLFIPKLILILYWNYQYSIQGTSYPISRILLHVHSRLLRPVLLASRDGEQRWFRDQRDLDYSAPRVWWLRTLLRRKAEVQGTRPSRPEKKGTRPIGNSRGIAVWVGWLLSGSGKALDTFLCPLHESGLVEGERM